MSRKTKPELDEPADETVELDEPTDDVVDEDASDDADTGDADADEPAPRKSAAKSRPAKSAGARKGKSTGGRGSGKSGASKSALVSGGKRAGKGGRAGHRPIKPVKVASDRPWGTIALFGIVALLFVSIVGYTSYLAWYNAKSPSERAEMISGIKDYTEKVGEAGQHDPADLTYDVTPPVGGKHNPVWQNCMGDVYDAPIADEHAVHSLEHGAIWITYQPDLPKDQVAELEKKVRGKDFMMLSPYEGLKSPVSLQAWGYQLQVDDAGDSRIDDFIGALRTHGPEKGAACSNGITVTGDKPREVQPPQQPGGGMGG